MVGSNDTDVFGLVLVLVLSMVVVVGGSIEMIGVYWLVCGWVRAIGAFGLGFCLISSVLTQIVLILLCLV